MHIYERPVNSEVLILCSRMEGTGKLQELAALTTLWVGTARVQPDPCNWSIAFLSGVTVALAVGEQTP